MPFRSEPSMLDVRLRTLAALGLIAIVLPAAAGTWAVTRVRADVARQVEEGQRSAARSVASSVREELDLTVAIARAAARHPALVERQAGSEIQKVLQNVASTTPGFRSLSVLDASGRPLAQVPASPVLPPEATATATAGVLPVRRVAGDGALIVREPVVSEGGRLAGFLVADISLIRAAPDTRTLRLGRTGRASALDRGGHFILTGVTSRTGTEVQSGALRALVRSWKGGTATYYSPTTHQDEIAAFTPIGAWDLAVLVTQAQSEAFAPVRRLTTVMSGGFVLLILVELTAAVLVMQTVGRYQRRLRERLEEQIRLNRALEAFSSRVAHDLRGPLTSIKMASEILGESSGALDDGGRVAMDVLGRQSDASLELVQALLDLARASGTPRPEPIHLVTLVSEAASDVEALRLRLEGGPEEVVADRLSLRQALVNLLQNASRYARRNGAAEVDVRWEESPDGWRVCVADRGPGLTPDEAELVFRPFARGGAGGGPKGGSGLGLTIVSAMAEAHGGRAWYEPREGGGSEFWIFLPRVPSRSRDADERRRV